jgi:Arc/MetJ-type ribon-helix-helix transcriptional regulator
MDPTTEKAALRALLDQLDAGTASLLDSIASRPREGLLFGHFEQYGLSDLDVALVLVSLKARLSGSDSQLGNELVGALPIGTAVRMAAMNQLVSGSPLLSAGLLLPDVTPATVIDVGSTYFRLSTHTFRSACEVFGQPATTPPDEPTGPYRSNAEVLRDLRRLSQHYRRRAARVFNLDPWTGAGLESADGSTILLESARAAAAHVNRRIKATEDLDGLPLLELKQAHDLDLDALVMLVTVLFLELLEGVGAVDAVDLVKLVSENESDLIRRRAILRPLQRLGLLQLEGSFPGKDLTADASLPNRVVDDLLGKPEIIDSDDRLDFHSYLEQLDSSDPFFFDMDGTGFEEL